MLGGLTIDYAERLVTVAGRLPSGAANYQEEYGLLFELSERAGCLLNHTQFLQLSRGPEDSGDVQLIRTHLRRLCHRLGEDASSPITSLPSPASATARRKGRDSWRRRRQRHRYG